MASFGMSISRYLLNLQRNYPQNTKGPNVGNLPSDLLLWARVSLWVLKVRLLQKRLPRVLAQVLHGGVLAGECSLECVLGELLSPWFYE